MGRLKSCSTNWGDAMRFTIRGLLLVTLIVALVLGWWADRWYLNRKLQEAEKADAAVKRAEYERFIFRFMAPYLDSATSTGR